MSGIPAPIVAAYKLFGLEGGEDIDAVRAGFRQKIKDVHPDTAGDDPEKIAELQKMLAAYEVLKKYAPRRFELTITPDEARKGGLRTVKIHERDAMIRMPIGVKNGTALTPIGDPHWRVVIKVQDVMVNPDLTASESEVESRKERARKFEEQKAKEAALEEAEQNASMFKSFYDKFVKASPAARFAKWARRGAA